MFKAGDTVAYLDEPGTGTVIEINGDQVLVADENGFEDTYPAQSLVLKRALKIDSSASIPQKDAIAPKANDKERPSQKNLKLECDLHFEVLVDFPKNYTNYQKLQIQLSEARKTLDKARKAGIKKVILIHGVGQGILREEVHTLLERLDDVQFYDASYAEYGRGATEVEIIGRR
jgi:hypothetical protein